MRSIKTSNRREKFHLNTCPLLSLTDILVHYLLLAQEKLSTFKTVKDYENWQIEVLSNGYCIANFDKGLQ
jgi:hypothetical protein